ncbi:hypothetical protein F5Y00DRAFT_258237 [Daldinia vernicosa]|uniref:uncharacterized protein n=1 Tax=Daldinia vernicosa TaxID=114800 RepID=UPI0020089742|nr:uncharacterized protein F5Y00DRAFT_258237 [Daldinia vernicosa]KAI0852981.1 hypothetical protein F5Y00DRAFT_258237 [Daldinia vernicosa]
MPDGGGGVAVTLTFSLPEGSQGASECLKKKLSADPARAQTANCDETKHVYSVPVPRDRKGGVLKTSEFPSKATRRLQAAIVATPRDPTPANKSEASHIVQPDSLAVLIPCMDPCMDPSRARRCWKLQGRQMRALDETVRVSYNMRYAIERVDW